MDAICSHNQVEPALSRTIEDHVHAARVRVQLFDHLVEQVLGISTACLDQDRAEVCPRHLHLSVFTLARTHTRNASATIIDEDQIAYVGCCVTEAREDTQPLGNLIGTLADVNRIAARSDTLIALHNCYLVPCTSKQSSQRRASDSGA